MESSFVLLSTVMGGVVVVGTKIPLAEKMGCCGWMCGKDLMFVYTWKKYVWNGLLYNMLDSMLIT